jgi:tetratricopeptide (TPR) repeat protein
MHDATITTPNDFFISYNTTDQSWAEWIAWQLEAAGYTVHIPAWDVRPGMNVILELDRATTLARQIIVILTPAYLSSLSSTPAWSTAFVQDPTSTAQKLLPIRVRECHPTGLLAALTPIDLADLSQDDARTQLLAGIQQGRAKPASEPTFPGEIVGMVGAGLAPARENPAPEPNFPGTWPQEWLVSYPRNQFFTGREKLLTTLHKKLIQQKRSQQATALTQAITGLGGIGKTQTALQYAYRYGNEYRYVLWANASSSENLLNDYVKFAARLHVPGYDAQDQRTALPAVKEWLGRQRDWLLILDNADELTTIQDFLPTGIHMRGHILLTTRASSLGPQVQTVEVSTMDRRDGVALLLKRSGLLTTSRRVPKKELRSAAETLVAEMDGLPLAIDQAAGYIEECRCSVQDYVQLYQTRRKDVLARKNRDPLYSYYEQTVATTWALSFARIRNDNPAAAELLRFCAFLAPDAIPEELITEGAQYLGDVLGPVAADPLQLNDAIEVLLRYSLVRRDPATKILTIHRLVQVVLKYDMEEEEQKVWAERTIEVVNWLISYKDYETPSHFERYLPHAYACVGLVDRYEAETYIAARLLHHAGSNLADYARYNEAKELYKKALEINLKVLGDEHRDVAATLHDIGTLFFYQNRYKEAEAFFVKALEIYDKTLNDQPYYVLHYVTATMNALAALYQRQQMYQQAITLYDQVLHIHKEVAGSIEYPPGAITLQNMALLYYEQRQYQKAEKLFKQALNILERRSGIDAEAIDIATIQYNLACLYAALEKYQEAEELYQEALNTTERVLGLDHPNTIRNIIDFAVLLRKIGRKEEATMLEDRLKKLH